MNKDSRIYVAGHTGLVGSAIHRELLKRGFFNVLTFRHDEYDLSDSVQTRALFDTHKPEYVFMAAAYAGGIQRAIDSPSQMLVENMLIESNVIKRAHLSGVKKLIFIASSCIYPVDGEQPYTEDQIGTGKTDENWGYAVAKIAGIELCHAYHKQYKKNFLSVVPCNMYGPNDNFQGKYSHVIPALIKKCVEADEEVTVWGDGHAKREFLFSEDFAEVCCDIMAKIDYEDIDGVVNIGTGQEIQINTVFETVKRVVGKPDLRASCNNETPGIPTKLMNCARLHGVLDWKPETVFSTGIQKTYDSYRSHN